MLFKEHLNKYLGEEDIDKLITALTLERTHSLIINPNKIDEITFHTMFPKVKKHPFLKNVFYYNPEDYEFGKSYLFDNGLFYIVDASSLLVSYFLNPKENSLILDMCAAPGGKTISTSFYYKNIELISNDISFQRALTLSSNIEKVGLSNISVVCGDFLKINNELNNSFDYIILDAPCSGSAMFRKMDEMEKDWSYEKVLKQQKIQIDLLNKAIDLVKPEGFIIYSTCSFSFEEDEEVILSVLKNRNDVEVIPLPHIDGEYRSKELNEAIHIFPHLYNGEGQFIAKLQKKKTTSSIKNITDKKIGNYKSNELDNFLNEYKLDFNCITNLNNQIYAHNFNFTLPSNIKFIRKGINICEIKNKNIFIPSFNLAHYLSSEISIKLDEKEAKSYLHGDTIKRNDLKNGYYVVSFNKINLGFVKCVNGMLKNFYPKGLRH